MRRAEQTQVGPAAAGRQAGSLPHFRMPQRFSDRRSAFLTILVILGGCGPADNSPPAASVTPGSQTKESTARKLDPRFPVIEGKSVITGQWSVTLPDKFNRRTECGDLIVWRPGLTIYVVAWNNEQNKSRAERLAWIKETKSADAFDAQLIDDGEILRFAYRLTEQRDKKLVHALYGYAIGANGHVQTAAYYDDESDLEVARQIWSSWSDTEMP